MKNLGEKLEVTHGARADDGTKLEPEEQGVRRTILTDAAAKHGDDAVGTMRASLVTEMSAAEAAVIFSQPCHLCAHWRPDEWPAARRKLESTPEGIADLNRMRAALLSSGSVGMENNGESFDVEHALAHGRIGVCKALTEILRDDMFTDRDATCPDALPDGSPLPALFAPRRGDERRASDATRDQILRLAQGRK